MTFEIEQIRGLLEMIDPPGALGQSVLTMRNLHRMAATAAIIPKASSPGARLIDIGGRVEWIPIYTKLLGYTQVTILERPGGSFLDKYRVPGQGAEFIADTIECDAELDSYPIASESVDCVVCFHLLEHFAGDPMHMIAESNRILKAGASMCLTTPNVLYYQNLVTFLFGGHPFGWSVFTDSYADRHNREYTPYEAKRLFEAGGFSVDLLQTKTHSLSHDFKSKLLGYTLCLLPVLLGRTSFGLRGEEMQVRGNKIGDVVERYPRFLYNLFGGSSVTVKIRNNDENISQN